MILHFIKVNTNNDSVNISFDNGNTWNSYNTTNNGTHIDDIEFSKKDCSSLDKIIIGKYAKHKPLASDTMTSYFNLENANTYYTTPENFKSLLSTLSENTPSTPYSIKIKGANINNINKIEEAYNALNKKVYIDLTPSDFRFNTDLFNNRYFLGESCQEYLTGITLPDDLNIIGNRTFYNCINLESIIIPKTVTNIEDYAFYSCSSLKNVTMHTGIKSIGEYAFGHCSKVVINYLGSKARWDKISIAETNRELFDDFTINTIVFEYTLDTLESGLKSQSYSPDNPIPINVSISNETDLNKLNNIIKSTEAYVDISAVDLSNVYSKFMNMNNNDSAGLFDNDTKQYITSISIPSKVTKLGKFIFSSYTNLSAVFIKGGYLTTISQGAFANCTSLIDFDMPISIKKIEPNAFYNCSNIKVSFTYTSDFSSFFEGTGLTKANVYGVTVPSKLTSINDYEFEDCINLSSIDLTTASSLSSIGIGAFKGCTKLKSISIPSSVTEIKDSTFENCTNINNVLLPSNLSIIGDNAFKNCINLNIIRWNGEYNGIVPKVVTNIGKAAFYKTFLSRLDLSNSSIKELSDYIFYGCQNFSELNLPDCLERIGSYSLYNCNNISTLSLPSSITEIADFVFYGTKISNIELPSSLTTLGIGTFKGSSISSINFPSNFTSIGEQCFMNSSLATINFSDSIKYIGANAFNGCTNLTNVILPENLEEIGYCAFANCSNLGALSIPDTVTGTKRVVSISNDAISSLTKITLIKTDIGTVGNADGVGIGSENKYFAFIPKNIEAIGYRECSIFENIVSLRIPSNIKIIEKEAFYDCTSLEDIYLPKSIEEIGVQAFSDCKSLKNIYYEGSQTEWETLATGWVNLELKADDGTILLDEYGNPIIQDIDKTYIKAGNDILFDNSVIIHFNSNSNNVLFDTTNDTDITECSFTRSKTYGNYNLLVDDNTDYIQISKFNTENAIIEVPSIIYSFGENSFANCSNLSISIKYTDSMQNYFQGSGISSSNGLKVFVPKNITVIPDHMFANYQGLTQITFEDDINLQRIGSYAFYKCTNIESLEIPETVTDIGSHAFQGCLGLKSITLNDEIKIINECTFEDCTNLASINYPATLEAIYQRAFYNCSSLESIEFEEALTTIGANAFTGCNNLKVTCHYNKNYSDGSSDWRDKSLYIGKSGISTQNIYELKIDSGLTEIPDSEFISELYPLQGESSQYKNLHKVTIPATVTRIGDLAFAECENLVDVIFEEGIQLKSIGYEAFYNCSSLKSFTLPDTLEEIGDDAFQSCSKIDSIIIPDNTKDIGRGVFSNCDSLLSVKLPSNINKIPDCMFTGCFNLKNVQIPETVTSFGEFCFMGCNSLEDFEIGNNVELVEANAFSYCINISITVHYNSYWNNIINNDGINKNQISCIHINNDITSIPNYQFENFEGLRSVVFTDEGESTVESIGIGAFKNCSSLKDIKLPETCSIIQDWAFSGTKFEKFTFPKNIERIANNVLSNCNSLKTVYFKGSPTKIGEYAFKNCTKLNNIKLPNSIESIGANSFWGCAKLNKISIPNNCTKIEDGLFHNCNSLTELTIPNCIIEIGNGSFYGCGLTTFSTENLSVQTIGNSCFENCTSLTDVNLIGILEIGSRAFYGCSSLSSITLPDTIESINFGTFEDCKSLKEFTIPTHLSYIEGNVFAGCSLLTISNVSNDNFQVIWDGKGIRNDTTLYSCIDTNNQSISVPNGIEKIGNGAFMKCTNIRRVDMPTVRYIDEYAFKDCTNLLTISITNKLKRIGTAAFENCTRLGITEQTGIYFNGTKAEWNRIDISNDGNTYILPPLRIEYSN